VTGAEMREIRRRMDLTQEELAKILSLSGKQSVWRMEQYETLKDERIAAHLRTLARLHDCERRGG
jgi:DNA-binding XRE family transcriptional regulator